MFPWRCLLSLRWFLAVLHLGWLWWKQLREAVDHKDWPGWWSFSANHPWSLKELLICGLPKPGAPCSSEKWGREEWRRVKCWPPSIIPTLHPKHSTTPVNKRKTVPQPNPRQSQKASHGIFCLVYCCMHWEPELPFSYKCWNLSFLKSPVKMFLLSSMFSPSLFFVHN